MLQTEGLMQLTIVTATNPIGESAFLKGCLLRHQEAVRSMDWDDYFRQQAAMYRQLAEQAEDAFIKQELLELAAVCEEVANNIEDRRASG
jgi:hypothetical protein